jgi:hypothetical protein
VSHWQHPQACRVLCGVGEERLGPRVEVTVVSLALNFEYTGYVFSSPGLIAPLYCVKELLSCWK